MENLTVPYQHLFRKKTITRILEDARNQPGERGEMNRSLSVFDLTGLGIAAVIGAGIFSTIGTAASSGGPAVSLLFLFTAVACAFSALCYAQFASAIPISGSAYTYAYASFGELIAWIIGWDLIMEYAIGNIAVAISWSDYFSSLMSGLGINIPAYCQIDFLTASRGYHAAMEQMAQGISWSGLPGTLQDAYGAWTSAPMVGGMRLIADVPAFSIVVLIATLVYIGIYETKVAANAMVLLKVITLLIVISVGAFYIDPENWNPFAPNGITGVLKGVSGVFFAYIGFDAISTTAEECRNPRRDMPRAIITALIITTILYVLTSLVLTGMVNFSELNVGDPLAYAFEKIKLAKLSGLIAVSAVIAMAGVLLVFQVGQPRIWMSMSRDGLLPKRFSRLHHRFRTPAFSTLISGTLVAIPSLFMNLTEVTDLCSIGTLFAFVLVSGGVLVIDRNKAPGEKVPKGFRVPFLNSRYFLPLIWIGLMILLFTQFQPVLADLSYGIRHLSTAYPSLWHHLPMSVFIIVSIVLTVIAIWKELSLIPVLGLLTNLYLMAQLGITNWMRFGIWLVIGLIIYFSYSVQRSKLRTDT